MQLAFGPVDESYSSRSSHRIMALKCRCICGCKLLVSTGSAGKRIKCPNCERKLRVPVDVVEKRRAQLEARGPKPQPPAQSTEIKRSKIEKPLSSFIDLPDPEPPPMPSEGERSPLASSDREIPERPSAEPKSETPPIDHVVESKVTQNPPPLPAIDKQRKGAADQPEVARDRQEPNTTDSTARALPASSAVAPQSTSDATEDKIPVAPRLEDDEAEIPVRGYLADRDKVATVRWLAASIMITGLVGMVPAIVDIVEHVLSQSSDGLSRWACAVLLVGILQGAYAVYLVQLPDWSSVCVVTCFTLAISAAYAAMFGLTLLSTDQGHFVQVLDLADRLRGNKATAWCLIMLSLMSLTSYISGRVGARWRNTFVG